MDDYKSGLSGQWLIYTTHLLILMIAYYIKWYVMFTFVNWKYVLIIYKALYPVHQQRNILKKKRKQKSKMIYTFPYNRHKKNKSIKI